MTRSKSPATVLNLDNAAGVFLELLVDLGHLDDKLLALMNDRLLDLDAQRSALRVRLTTLIAE